MGALRRFGCTIGVVVRSFLQCLTLCFERVEKRSEKRLHEPALRKAKSGELSGGKLELSI